MTKASYFFPDTFFNSEINSAIIISRQIISRQIFKIIWKLREVRLIVDLYKVIFCGLKLDCYPVDVRQICTFATIRSISPPPSKFCPLIRRFRCRNGSNRMRVRTRWFRAKRMVFALLGWMRKHAAQFRTR